MRALLLVFLYMKRLDIVACLLVLEKGKFRSLKVSAQRKNARLNT